MLEVYCVAPMSRRKLTYACKLLCVELYKSRNTRLANKLGVNFHILIFSVTRLFTLSSLHLRHGGVVLCSVQWRHCILRIHLWRIPFDKPKQVLVSTDFSFHLQNRNRFGSDLANWFRDGLLHNTKMVESSNECMYIFSLTNCWIILL